MYVGLDIGTTSIKVIVAEKVQGQINVLGIGNEHSEGVSRGIIVDIDKAAQSIKRAAAQAEDKSSVQINDVIVGIPSNSLKIEKCSGMIAVADESKEIDDDDVRRVTNSALTKNLPPEREIIDILPDEFVVDGFNGIKDPRGMVGVRLEIHGRLITGPKTIIHNTRKAVEHAGLRPSSIVVNSLAQGKELLDDGEQDFGTILLDLGGGQSTASIIHDHQLKFTSVDNEGGEYITKDISVVLNTSIESAEKIKRDYGYAYSIDASNNDEFPIDVVGQSKPVKISEKYLSEIIQARLEQIFERLGKKLDDVSALDLPGGIVLTGGVAALPGVSELAADQFGTNVRVYIPNQMGLRHPSFSLPLALVSYRANMSEIESLVRSSLFNPTKDDKLINSNFNHIDDHQDNDDSNVKPKNNTSKNNTNTKPIKKRGNSIKHFFTHFFD